MKPGESSNHFYHAFGILPRADGIPLPRSWFHLTGGRGEPAGYACFREPVVMDLLKPQKFHDGTSGVPHARHFDAHVVADFLRRWGRVRIASTRSTARREPPRAHGGAPPGRRVRPAGSGTSTFPAGRVGTEDAVRTEYLPDPAATLRGARSRIARSPGGPVRLRRVVAAIVRRRPGSVPPAYG
jgi:Tryptophan halogenase